MPLVPFELSDHISIPITSKTIGGVQFDAEVHVDDLGIEFNSRKVVLYVTVHYLDSEGEHLTVDGKTLGFARTSTADMSFFVDVTTGIPLAPVSEEYVPNPVPQEEGDEDYQSEILNPALEGKNYLHEWRFFRQMMHIPVSIYDMIVAKVQYADAVGRFN